MKCVKCGAELKEGCVYCSVCGTESRIGPDYSVLEDDYLRALLTQEEEKIAQRAARPDAKPQRQGQARQPQPVSSPDGAGGKKPAKKKKTDGRVPILIVCGLLVVAILLGVLVKVMIDRRNANSYEYQVESAEQEMIDKNYEKALHYYKTALALRPDDVPVRLAMAEIYMEQSEYDSAAVLLTEVVDLDPENKAAYQSLIQIYEEKKDYESIALLSEGVKSEAILKLFADYLVAAPVFVPVGGEYDEYITVELTSLEGYDIYYTLDGSDPDAASGTSYDPDEEGILLDEAGTYTVRAVCVNEKGIASEIAEAEYEITVVAPAFATVSPDGGRIDAETTVTIQAEEDCSIYYTWDGTDPTQASLKYQEPLEIPVGNNILSVLVVNDKTGLDSGVYRTNFIYYP